MTAGPGDLFGGRYRVLREVPGAVRAHLVEDTATRRQRRLDLLAAQLETEEDRERFAREAFVELESPYVCAQTDAGVDPESATPYLVSEVVGDTLASVLQRGALELATADALLKAICDGLATGHRAGIVHQQLSPALIDVATDGGSAKVRYLPKLERPRALGVPEPAYLAPEQVEIGAAVTPRIDVWAIGLIAYEMLTGSRYFGGDEVVAVYKAVLIGPIEAPSARAVGAELPAGFDEWFAKCVTRNVADRYPDAAAAYVGFRALVVRDRILERRQRFVSETVSGVTAAGGSLSRPKPCLMVVPSQLFEQRRPQDDLTYRQAPPDVSAMPCLMIPVRLPEAELRVRERTKVKRYVLLAAAILLIVGVIAWLIAR